MKVAVASGKGGTGKTTLAVNLAVASALRDRADAPPVWLLDCDVEEPNDHLFLDPKVVARREMTQPVPFVVEERCEHCGVCAEVCEFNAIACTPKSTIIFPELCHSCGACVRFCPRKAIEEKTRTVGVIERADALDGRLHLVTGRLEIGQPSASPLIREVQGEAPPGATVVLDAPPGAACPVVETLRGADVVLLVTEPTPFGLHDLRLAAELVRDLERDALLVINRSGDADAPVLEFAAQAGLPVAACIPFERRYAEIQARGGILVLEDDDYRLRMEGLLDRIEAAARSPQAASAREGDR